jgi:transposase
MIQVTPHMRIVVAVEPVDFRNGIDGLARICKEVLKADPFAGWLFLFRGRRGTAVKALCYDGQGFYLVQNQPYSYCTSLRSQVRDLGFLC